MKSVDGYGRATDPEEVLAVFSAQRIANAGVNGMLASYRVSIQAGVPKCCAEDVEYFLRDVWVMLASGKLVLSLPDNKRKPHE
jgi:hypothetical protein